MYTVYSINIYYILYNIQTEVSYYLVCQNDKIGII